MRISILSPRHPRRSAQDRLEVVPGLRRAPGHCVESIRDQIEQGSRDLLRINVRYTRGRIKIPLHRDIEARLFGPRTVIGQVRLR